MSGKRDIEPSRFRDSALARSLGLGVAVAVFAVVALTLPKHEILALFSRQQVSTAAQHMEPDIFAARFPVELGIPSKPAQREANFKRGVAQLSDAMRSAAPSIGPEGLPATVAGSPKVPVPRSRPAVASLITANSATNDPQQEPATGPMNVGEAIRNVFAMLPSGLQLASANPDGGILSDGQDKALNLAGYGKRTAVYDIGARTVYMPDGSRLEAHSGLGELMDDVRFVHVHDRGPTPPNVYELSLREKPFHGVKALRMKAVGESELFGRNGLLVHSNLIGPIGDSNGCVSIKNYQTFLEAFANGDVKRLVVVRSMRDDAIKLARKI